MTARFASGGRRPSATAAFHASAYHAHETPLAESVSPIVLPVCGGRGCFAGSARSRLPPGAGGVPLGWYGGSPACTAYPSGVTWPSRTSSTGPSSTEAGDDG